jgi:prepilin-type N-terminal cleavage/methylation domain-containing protein/prepilin-type processing-associated H-X9-DG protein
MQAIECPLNRIMNSRDSKGFTLTELLVVIVVIVILASVMTPVLSRTKPTGQSIRCLNNMKQLITSWQMYSQDNGDKLVIMLHGGEAQGAAGDPVWGVGWAEGWLDWTLSTDNTNLLFLVDPRFAKLANYVRGNTNIFKCPADTYISPAQKARGWTARVRSYSGSVGIGAGNAEGGPWDTTYNHVTKISQFLYPTPSETWVFLEEHPDSMNDPAFFSPQQLAWIDMPATYHNGAASFAFADGHSEMHKWTESLTRAREVTFGWNPPVPGSGDRDIHWMSFHTQRRTSASY